MPRPPLPRRIGQRPQATYYKPAGVPLHRLQEVVLALDELEALRLVDLEGLYQEAAAERMQISRPTLSRILAGARQKVAGALVLGQALRVEGGAVRDDGEQPSNRVCQRSAPDGLGAGRRRRRRGVCADSIASHGSSTMKIVITAQAGTLEAAVDPQFGRAAVYVLYDLETGAWSAHDNGSGQLASQGAGVQGAQTIIEFAPTAVVTGHCGPKAFRALQAAGIAVYTGASGTVREAIEALREGRLEKTEAATVASHSGVA
ncbi:DUF134 domain-containing protein [Thiococcus pfennigii]|uniref:DUF134 domain-containing protein n=1 Tax=Thiococcus pfennigii TaxID=1057 RepID=UPI001904516B|nr:DUF134 domain-containing protein [Thiococcus pfennigii]MBK1700609.1 hypothetical protein [Thiococcus pfennigii]MBK1732559.1 hypothetical protein [Thiococcus pfennigii]